MIPTVSLKERFIQFLHETFSDSREIPADEINRLMDTVLQKAEGYGLDAEADMAVYVVTTYLLGENFDSEMPAAAHVLGDPSYSSSQKAAFLESWTQQLFQTLEQDAAPAEEERESTGAQPAEATLSDYLSMQGDSQPYREVAEWAVGRLIAGDADSVIQQFSPNFLQQLGLPMVEWVFQEQMLPFFAGSTGLENSTTVTMTHDAFGSNGFAFYLTLIGVEGEKPFVMYLVKENNVIVVANLVLNKTYADLHWEKN